jgi:DNA-binding NarL/FixJ family response regulator
MHFIILEDHALVRDGIKEFVARNFPASNFPYLGDSLKDAIQVAHSQPIDAAIVDLDLGDGTSVVDVVSSFQILKIPVVVVSAHGESSNVQSAIAAGAAAFVTKRSSLVELKVALDNVLRGNQWMSADLAEHISNSINGVELSEQERKALTLYASGLTMEAVARRMNISENTAKYYIGRVRDKYQQAGIQARTKVELNRAARDAGLIN